MSEETLDGLVAAWARTAPDAVAVVDGDRVLSYAELDDAADRVAAHLCRLGTAPGDRVGLWLDKSLEAVVGLYGILRAGAAYVPLDPGAPTARLGYIARDCGIGVVLTDTAHADRWGGLVEAGAVLTDLLVLDGEPDPAAVPAGATATGRDALEAEQPARTPVPRHTDDLAYVLYTSGSTGHPKGVMLTHGNGLAFVRFVVDHFGITSTDRLSSHAPFHFDLSILDLYAASLAGAAVVLVPARASTFPSSIRRFIVDQRITVWYSVPSILTMLTLRGGLSVGDLPELRLLFFAGEVFPTPYLRELAQRLPHVALVNLYGPTETNVCTWYAVPPGGPAAGDDADIPIGRPITDVDVIVADDDGNPVDGATTGEAWVRGPTVALGYWGDEARTAQVFVTGVDGERYYRTGDLVRDGGDGELRFLGRRDSQVKSRGYRIELGEIETALSSHPSIAACAVVAVPDPLVTNRLAAFVASDGELGPKDLATYCASRLPGYMVPDQWEVRRALPLTSTGKIDRQALLRDATDAAR